MKRHFLFVLAVLLLSIAPVYSQTTTLDAKTKAQVLRDIRYMIYDEIHILAHRYLNTDQAGAANSMKIGQQKIDELQSHIKSLCGGNDAPNSFYKEAVGKARDMGKKQIGIYFTTPDQQAEVEKVYQKYGQMGVAGQ